MPKQIQLKEAFREISRRYNKNPEGWKIWVKEGSTSDRQDLYVSSGKRSWFIALFADMPESRGRAIKFKKPIKQEVARSSGIRPLTEEEFEQFMKLASQEAWEKTKEAKWARERRQKLELKASKKKPVSQQDLEREAKKGKPAFMVGPFYRGEPKGLDALSPKHRELRERLRMEVDRMRDQKTRYIR